MTKNLWYKWKLSRKQLKHRLDGINHFRKALSQQNFENKFEV